MNYRKIREQLEKDFLSKYAVKSSETMGRKLPEEKCHIRTEFQRDRDRIIHSKSFRRLKHKTQVFIAPEGDHFRTRLTHTLEVSQIARTMARALNLNEDLVEAIALGHDLGHTPFGHIGEDVLNKLNPNGFKHYKQSIRVVEFLEHSEKRSGLNLTYEVLDGIINHSGDKKSMTLEGQIIKYADRFAYINHDIDDALRALVITEADLPKESISILGSTHSQRIGNMIEDLIENSYDKAEIKTSKKIGEETNRLREFLFKNVYFNPIVRSETNKIENMLKGLYNYYLKDLNRLPKSHLALYENRNDTKDDIVCDYIAGMTDIFAVNKWREIFEPKHWK
ncbi:MAG: deoxyguanosinetriphosphate triphosphohydrolase [Tissierellia bacterium]|nr:deoxyguanosinetriphosphate triphosphohydrolase [Tissierellia bacterium]